MHLIKVNAINSTNSFAREMFRENQDIPATCIVAKKQLDGRGQRGTSWNSQEGKNLTISVIWPKPAIPPGQQFLMSAAVATTIVETLEEYNLPRLKVKWPNDILSANYKIGGLLIENVIAEGKMAASVIGLGLNVNQENFEGLPAASSMRLVSGREYDLEEVLQFLLKKLEAMLSSLSEKNSEEILSNYKKHLFRYRETSTFQLPDNSLFTGAIYDVSPFGKLIVKTEDDSLTEYDLKEIKLCY